MADILVVDDQELIRHLLDIVITNMGHTVTLASDGEEALRLCQAQTFDLVVLDYRMPGMNGLDVAEHLKGRMPFILHTADYHNQALKQKAMKAGALGVVAKINVVTAFRKNLEAFLKM